MSKPQSILNEFNKMYLKLQLADINHGSNTMLHPSLRALYRVTFNHVRDYTLNGLSRHGVLGLQNHNFDKICELAAKDLNNLFEAINEVTDQYIQVASTPDTDTLKTPHLDVAVIVVAANNHMHLKLCLNSIAMYTNIPYDLYVIDCGSRVSSIDNMVCSGQLKYERLHNSRLKSFATAWGIQRAWCHKYVVILNSNVCAIASDWLKEMIAELEESDDIGAIGIHYGGQLDYETQETARHLRDYVLSDRWYKSLRHASEEKDNDLLNRLSVNGKTCFSELTGVIQIYPGHMLRRIGVPIVDDRILKHTHWDSELSMRALASGYEIKNSKTASLKLKFFGERYNSGIPDVSSYMAFVEQDRSWLSRNGYENLALLLVEETKGKE